MNKLIAAASITLASLGAHAAVPQMTEIDWDVLRVISRINPPQHLALHYVANECRLVPNQHFIATLLHGVLLSEVTAAVPTGQLPVISAESCATLGSADTNGF